MKKLYFNGKTQEVDDFRKAREILVGMSIYQTLGNFAPYDWNKTNRIVKYLRSFEKDGFEFTIIESEVMSLSLNTLNISKPHLQKECWFQSI